MKKKKKKMNKKYKINNSNKNKIIIYLKYNIIFLNKFIFFIMEQILLCFI